MGCAESNEECAVRCVPGPDARPRRGVRVPVPGARGGFSRFRLTAHACRSAPRGVRDRVPPVSYSAGGASRRRVS